MWASEEFYTDKEGKHTTPTILSTQAGFEVVPTPEKDIKVDVEDVSSRFARFYATNMAKTSYNPVEKNLNSAGAYCLVARKDTTLLAGMVCVPHTLYIHTIGCVRAVLSTHLLVHVDHRSEGLARSIIMAAVKEGYTRDISLGYHWLTDTKSKAAIRSLSWYRPLLPAQAAKHDYELIKDADYTLPTIPKEYTLVNTEIEDFKTFASVATIRLQPTVEEFILLNNILTFLTVRYDDVIVAILAYRPFTIVKPKITCYAAQLCYFDALKGHAIPALTLLFEYLQKKNFIALHGVFMSQLSYTVATLKLTLTPLLSVDFYNLAHPGILNTGCSLLYI